MQPPRGSKVRLARVQPTTRAQPAGRRLAAITRASLPSLTTASARKKPAEGHAQRKEKMMMKPKTICWLQNHRTDELYNDRKYMPSVRSVIRHGSARGKGRQEGLLGVGPRGGACPSVDFLRAEAVVSDGSDARVITASRLQAG